LVSLRDLRDKLPSIVLSYAMGSLYARLSYLWASAYDIKMIPDPGYPVKSLALYITNHFGIYHLLIVSFAIALSILRKGEQRGSPNQKA
jgi:membrane-bound metal-dependent hydrolase YbcI (DUF457 family)